MPEIAIMALITASFWGLFLLAPKDKKLVVSILFLLTSLVCLLYAFLSMGIK